MHAYLNAPCASLETSLRLGRAEVSNITAESSYATPRALPAYVAIVWNL